MRDIAAFVTRRRFLRLAGTAAAGVALPYNILFAKTGGSSRLVVVVLRGALDGLAAVPPYADRDYVDLRRELAIAAPGEVDGAHPLDGRFGLHPSLRFLHDRYLAGELVVFHAVASPYRDRSHFDGQNVLENGLTQPIGTADGWLNRALAALAPGNARRGEEAVAVSQNIPLILRGEAPVFSKSPMAMPDLDEDFLARLGDLYSKDDWFSARLSEAVQSESLGIESVGTMAGATKVGAAAAGRLMGTARMAAALMRSDAGPEVAVLEAIGWDTHANQGGAKGVLSQRLAGLDDALRELAEGLGPLWAQTAVLVVTEFGRTAAVNGTRGTDHGTGAAAFLAGGAVSGGRVETDWPGLSRQALLDNRDLRPTLDLRSIFKGVLRDHMRIHETTLATRVFPNSGGARPLQGLIRA